MALTAFTWPRFSATRMIATGTIRPMASALKTGAAKCGRPNQAAAETAAKSMGLPMPRPLAKMPYTTQARIMPTRISRRCTMPLVNTAMPPTQRMVTIAMTLSKPDAPMAPLAAMGARFRPITATTAPVTTGGISVSIQFAPPPARAFANHTIRPISV
ncbi:hypothetical protein ADE_49750 [Achromobacter denitrificans]|nr:hypothetical protein ADE_49750 [Achromobacter denitrificans]